MYFKYSKISISISSSGLSLQVVLLYAVYSVSTVYCMLNAATLHRLQLLRGQATNIHYIALLHTLLMSSFDWLVIKSLFSSPGRPMADFSVRLFKWFFVRKVEPSGRLFLICQTVRSDFLFGVTSVLLICCSEPCAICVVCCVLAVCCELCAVCFVLAVS